MIDPNEINPIYPGAISLHEAIIDADFIIIDLFKGPFYRGKIIGERYYFNDSGELKMRVKNKDSGAEKEIRLSEAGIMRNGEGLWDTSNFSVKDDPAELKIYEEWLKNDGKQIIEKATKDRLDAYAKCFGIDKITKEESGQPSEDNHK